MVRSKTTSKAKSAPPSKRTSTIRRGQRNNLPFQEKENKLPLSKN
jgi:hypothetical protein